MNNLRVKYTRHPQIGELRILEEDHYYPFELKHHGYNQERFTIGFDQHKTDINLIGITRDAQDTYRYKFGGKEYQNDFDVNLYDFGARNYDAALGRWMNVDPLAEYYPGWSPYNYTLQNPVRLVDPDGRSVDDIIISHKGKSYKYEDGRLYLNGREYTGKQKVFLKQTVNSLNTIGKSQEGKSLLSELQSSSNTFTISKGDSEFKASNYKKAYANQFKTDPKGKKAYEMMTDAGVDFSGGSGGNIT